MRLGGFVTHGNHADTLPACLTALTQVCDEVVAVDSGSTDGSAALVRAAGVRAVAHPWEGYKAARAAGARALEGCDWVLCLDADEWLEEPARARLRAWKAGVPDAPAYRLPRRDWAFLSERQFLYRTTHCQRLIRRDLARWESRMGVHDPLKIDGARPLDAWIEHRYATSVEHRGGKESFYALLWALEAYRDGRRPKWPAGQRLALFVREALVKGAALRGGAAGARLAWRVAGYHEHKHRWLRRLRAGELAELASAMGGGQYRQAFEGAALAVERARSP